MIIWTSKISECVVYGPLWIVVHHTSLSSEPKFLKCPFNFIFSFNASISAMTGNTRLKHVLLKEFLPLPLFFF